MTTTGKPKRGLLGKLFGGGPAVPVVLDPALDAQSASPDDLPPEAAAYAADETDSLEVPAADETAGTEATRSWFQRLKSGLAKTSSQLARGISDVFAKRRLDGATLEDLENLLIQADLGIETAGKIAARLKAERYEKSISPEDVRRVLASEIAKILAPVAKPLLVEPARKPHVVLMVGVNGTGKTTTIGKLAEHYRKAGLKVMLAAGDTFRAAAIDQLRIWASRTGAAMVAREVGSDAASLAFDAVTQAKAGQYDLLLIDTAGRLQNKDGLMQELEKVVRVIKKVDATAPHDVLLTLCKTDPNEAAKLVGKYQPPGVSPADCGRWAPVRTAWWRLSWKRAGNRWWRPSRSFGPERLICRSIRICRRSDAGFCNYEHRRAVSSVSKIFSTQYWGSSQGVSGLSKQGLKRSSVPALDTDQY